MASRAVNGDEWKTKLLTSNVGTALATVLHKYRGDKEVVGRVHEVVEILVSGDDERLRQLTADGAVKDVTMTSSSC